MIFQEAGLSRSKVQPTLAAQGQSKRDLTGGIYFYLMLVAEKDSGVGVRRFGMRPDFACVSDILCALYNNQDLVVTGDRNLTHTT